MIFSWLRLRNWSLSIALSSAGALAQPLPDHEDWGEQRVLVANGCVAFSMLPNDPRKMTVEWRGPCRDGLAHGDGLRVVRMQSVVMSVGQTRYNKGRLEALHERYYFELGTLYRRVGPDTGTAGEKGPFRTVPSWAEEVVGAAPVWAQWHARDMERRRAEIATIHGIRMDAEAEMPNGSDPTKDEKKPEGHDATSTAHRLF